MGFWRSCRERNNEETRRRERQESRGTQGWLFGLLAGVFFLWAGAARGELAVIWKKAVMICMECIGIG